MRAPPAVSVQGAGGPLWAALCTGLPALALAAVLAWLGGWAQQPALGFAAAALGGVGLGAWLYRRHPPRPVHLAWDGQRWMLDGREAGVELMLDAGSLLLLRGWPPALPRRPWQARWLALSAAEAGSAAHLLRVALHQARPLPDPLSAPPAGAGRAE